MKEVPGDSYRQEPLSLILKSNPGELTADEFALISELTDNK